MGIRRQRWCCYWISSPILPYSLFLLLLSLSFPPSFTQPTNNTELYYDRCANSLPFHCGNIQAADIKYPFWTPDSGRPEFCGHPGFTLRCQDEDKLMISIGDDDHKRSYHVMEKIDYQNRVLHVIDAQLLNDATTSSSWCPEKLSNTILDFSLFSYLDGDGNYYKDINLTLFLNCKLKYSLPSPLIDFLFPIIQCSDVGQYSYFTLQSMIDGSSLSDLDHYCSSIVLLPVYNNTLIQGLLAPDNYKHVNYANFSNALKVGFGLTWNVGKVWCDEECLKSGGICGSNITTDHKTPACFCPKGTATNGYSCTNTSKPVNRRKNILIIIGSLSGVAVILLICCLCSLCYCKKRQQHTSATLLSVSCWHRRTSEDQTIEAFLQKHGTLPPKRYNYLEVKRMTESFHHKLGEGGFGSVFKGTLADGRAVAVKLLNNTNGDGEDFLNEVASIGRTSHINIVSLLGFCFQGSKRALIYDFMPNGSLEKYIYAEDPKTILGWEKLFQIAIGIARGLEYLHRGCNTRIVHFDIKPHNILLDEDFCPKISDFGLAKLGTHKESILSMAGARGTVGFIAPEVFFRNFGVVSTKSDVYSYGMMLLEMAGGRRNFKVIVDRTSEIYFPHWIYDHLHNQDEWLQYCRVTLDAQEIARKLIIVGLWCIQTRPECRPAMSQVVEMLQGSITDLKIPPKPYLSSPPRSPSTC